jgi:predicted nucleotidyltransferase
VLDIVRRYGAHNVRVFGSVARGDDGPSSDIDLLVDIPDDMGLFTLARMQLDVEQVLGESVDLVPSRMLKSGVRQSADLDGAPL